MKRTIQAVFVAGFTAFSSQAAVIALPDITRAAGDPSTRDIVDLPSTISNDIVYLVGTINYLPDASGADVTVAFSIDAEADRDNPRGRLGFGSRGTAIRQLSGNGTNDPDGDGPATDVFQPSETIDTTPGVTTSVTFVLKVIQTAPRPGGDFWYGDFTTPGAQDDAGFFYWINPNLSQTEDNNPTNLAGWRSGNNGYKSVLFTTSGNAGPVEFSNFALYTDGDTPFVPEPGSLALLGLGGMLIARRRRSLFAI